MSFFLMMSTWHQRPSTVWCVNQTRSFKVGCPVCLSWTPSRNVSIHIVWGLSLTKVGYSCHLTPWHVFLPAKKRTRHGTRGVDSDSAHAYTTLTMSVDVFNFVDGGIHMSFDGHHPTDLRYLCVQNKKRTPGITIYFTPKFWCPCRGRLGWRWSSEDRNSFTSVWKEECTCIPSPISCFHHLDHLLYSFQHFWPTCQPMVTCKPRSPSPFQNKLWEEGFLFFVFRSQLPKGQVD